MPRYFLDAMVLLVESDDYLRVHLAAWLCEHGCRVEPCAGGREAFAFLDTTAEPIDFLHSNAFLDDGPMLPMLLARAGKQLQRPPHVVLWSPNEMLNVWEYREFILGIGGHVFQLPLNQDLMLDLMAADLAGDHPRVARVPRQQYALNCDLVQRAWRKRVARGRRQALRWRQRRMQ